jgi:hypothetical protein
MSRAAVALFAVVLLVGAAHAATLAPSTFPPAFGPKAFTDPTHIDNQYLPLTPCIRLVYEGVEAGHKKEKRLAVGSLPLMVAGVRCLDVTVGVSIDGKPTSVTEECYAQDDAGNVWLMSQGSFNTLCPLFVGFPCGPPLPPVAVWSAGVDGVVPVLTMAAQPRAGQIYFRRDPLTGKSNAIVVVSRTASIHVPYGDSVRDVLVTRETSLVNPGLPGYRYYAPGVGLLKSTAPGATMELVSVENYCQIP